MKKTLIAAGSSLILLLGACSKDPNNTDFRKETEKFLEGSKVEQQAGQKFSAAKCDEPSNTTVGTEYTCTATGADGKSYTFGVKIDKKNSFLVETVKPADATGASTTTPTDAVNGTDTTLVEDGAATTVA